MKKDTIYVYGKHAVMEAIRYAPHSIRKVFLSKENEKGELADAVKKIGLSPLQLGSDSTSASMKDVKAHQGVIAHISLTGLIHSYKDFIQSLTITPDTSFLILGELEDPHNVGAVIRSAAAFGVSGVILASHNQAPITGTVAKVSAGMAFRVPLISVSNINETIRDLKKRDVWVYGLAGEKEQSLTEERFDKPTAFVIGNEAKGIREKTREECDMLLSIPMHERAESLNVAASTAVALYAWSVQHSDALEK